MKLPRDLSGHQLVQSLSRLGYEVVRQTGSHIRLQTQQGGEHSITIPDHASLKIGLLSAILRDVANHHELARDDLIQQLFD